MRHQSPPRVNGQLERDDTSVKPDPSLENQGKVLFRRTTPQLNVQIALDPNEAVEIGNALYDVGRAMLAKEHE